MPSILVVDDNPADRRLATHHLEKLGEVRLLFARDGEEAMQSISQEMPDLVLTDLRMPVMDGLELVSRVRAEFPIVPVILMTSHGSEHLAVEALRRGAASYVSKSLLERDLIETVEHVLSASHAHRQRLHLLKHLVRTESHFEIENDPALIPALIGHIQESLERRQACDEAERTRIGMALQEALDNALYHGNLELSSDLRENDLGDFYNLASQRRGQQPYCDRHLHITVREDRDRVVYVIRDEGKGFNPHNLPDPIAPENMDRVSGRGLLLMRTFMDSVEHNELGNEVTLTKHIRRAEEVPEEPGAAGTASGSPTAQA